MRQTDLNRPVARATGETVSEVARHGFQLLERDQPPRDVDLLDHEKPSTADPPRNERIAS